jgi:SRSO17 transposase
MARSAGRLVGGFETYLGINNTARPKKGTCSVGVARQYCGLLSKRAKS